MALSKPAPPDLEHYYKCVNCNFMIRFEPRFYCGDPCDDFTLCRDCNYTTEHPHHLEELGCLLGRGNDDGPFPYGSKEFLAIERSLMRVNHGWICDLENCPVPYCKDGKDFVRHANNCPKGPEGCDCCREWRNNLRHHALYCKNTDTCVIFECDEVKKEMQKGNSRSKKIPEGIQLADTDTPAPWVTQQQRANNQASRYLPAIPGSSSRVDQLSGAGRAAGRSIWSPINTGEAMAVEIGEVHQVNPVPLPPITSAEAGGSQAPSTSRAQPVRRREHRLEDILRLVEARGTPEQAHRMANIVISNPRLLAEISEFRIPEEQEVEELQQEFEAAAVPEVVPHVRQAFEGAASRGTLSFPFLFGSDTQPTTKKEREEDSKSYFEILRLILEVSTEKERDKVLQILRGDSKLWKSFIKYFGSD